MAMSGPVTMLVSYYPKKGRKSELLSLIKKHWAVLDRERLVTGMPAQIWRATDKVTKRSYFIEMFQWKDDKASSVAHNTPGVMAVWKPMEAVLEKMELAQIEPIRVRRETSSAK